MHANAFYSATRELGGRGDGMLTLSTLGPNPNLQPLNVNPRTPPLHPPRSSARRCVPLLFCRANMAHKRQWGYIQDSQGQILVLAFE